MHHEQPIRVPVAWIANHRSVGSSFFQPSWAAVSRVPIATSTPEWWEAAAVGSTIWPKRRLVYRRASRGIKPVGSSCKDTYAMARHLSLGSDHIPQTGRGAVV